MYNTICSDDQYITIKEARSFTPNQTKIIIMKKKKKQKKDYEYTLVLPWKLVNNECHIVSLSTSCS